MYIPNDRSDLIGTILSGVLSNKKSSISKIIDLGCNDGATLIGLKNSNIFNKKTKYYGVDYEKFNNDDFIFHHCDLNANLDDIKEPLKKSDLILLLDVLEHLYDPEGFINKLADNLKEDASLIITVPNASSIRMLFSWLVGDFPRRDIGYYDRTHRSWFTIKSLINMINNRFNLINSGYVYSNKKSIKIIQHIAPNRLTSQFYILLAVR